ncbi:MAG: hypothetical protein WBQ94_21640, partial [Terracidiphilus sp.]
MKKFTLWPRRLVVAAFFLLISAWLLAEVFQYRLRWRAESMLADIRSLNVNQSSATETKSILNKWERWGEIQTSCRGDSCQYFVRVTCLPSSILILNRNPDAIAKNLMLRIADNVGLRSSATGAGFTLEHGIVTGKEFAEQVSLPVRDWYSRERAYVPELLVSSGETTRFRDVDDNYLLASHPSRMARYAKGPWYMMVKFKPDESNAEKSALMDFRFSCITQFLPCKSEREIL